MKTVISFYHRNIARLVAVVSMVALVLSSCGASTAPTTAPKAAPATTSVQLSWVHTIEWAGFYIAQEKGYYTEEGLTTNLLPGGSDAQGNYIDPITMVLSGTTDFGVINGGSLIEAREKGHPVVAIATIYQRHPLTFASLAEKGIATPADLIGKNVQVHESSRLLFDALLRAQKIDPAQVKITPRTDYTTAPLLSGQADVIDAWVTNEVVLLERDGVKINTILPLNYGVEEYPNVIFTSEKTIADRPALVESFLRATVRGLNGAVEDPKLAASLAVKQDPSLKLESETEAMQHSLPLLSPPESSPGMMNDKTWTTTERILRDQGILTKPVDIKKVYTLTFLEKIQNAR